MLHRVVPAASLLVAALPSVSQADDLVVTDGLQVNLPTGDVSFEACDIQAGGTLVLNGPTQLTCETLRLSGVVLLSGPTRVTVTNPDGISPALHVLEAERTPTVRPRIGVDYGLKAEDGEQAPLYGDGTPGRPGVGGYTLDLLVAGDVLVDGFWLVELSGQQAGDPGGAGGRLSQTPACTSGTAGGDGAPGGDGGPGGHLDLRVDGRIVGTPAGKLRWELRGGYGSDGGCGGEGGNGGFAEWDQAWNPDIGAYESWCICNAGPGADGGDGAPPGRGGAGGTVRIEADALDLPWIEIDVSAGGAGWEAGCEGPAGRAGETGTPECTPASSGSAGRAAPAQRGGRGGLVSIATAEPLAGLFFVDLVADGGYGSLAGHRWGYVDQLHNWTGQGGPGGQIRLQAPAVDGVTISALGGAGGAGRNGLNRDCFWDGEGTCAWTEIGDGGDGASGGSGGIVTLTTDAVGDVVTYAVAGGEGGAGGVRGRPSVSGPYGAACAAACPEGVDGAPGAPGGAGALVVRPFDGPTPPHLTAPADGAVGVGGTVTLAWAPTDEEVAYVVHVCDDPNPEAHCEALVPADDGPTPLPGSLLGAGVLLILADAIRRVRRRPVRGLPAAATLCVVALASCGGEPDDGDDTDVVDTDTDVPPASGTSLEVSGLAPDTDYFWTVGVRDADGGVAFSEVWTFRTAP